MRSGKKQLLGDCEVNTDSRYHIVLGDAGIGISAETSLKTLDISSLSQKSHTLQLV